MQRFLAGLGCVLATATALGAQDWDDRIAAAQATAGEIEAWAAGHGWDYNRIGSFTRAADLAVIRCTVLAERLGIGDIAAHVAFDGPDPTRPGPAPDPATAPDDGALQEMLTYAWNLQTWATMAEQALAYSDDQSAETWELQCRGRHGIPEGLGAAAWDRGASFRVDGHRLYVLGDIEPGFYEEFAAVVAGHDIGIVMLGSRGGSVEDAMQAGGLIRQKGLGVELFGDCESACPLVYFGGAEPRVQRLPLHRLGFHQISAGGTAIPLDHVIYETVAAYIDALGVDSDYILTAMQDTPLENMYYPAYQWLCDANAGWFYGNCTQAYPR